MTWYLAPALDTLRAQINARWPARDRTSDGTIGDAAHSARVSDHNPDPTSSPPGIVRAIDIDEDGIDTGAVILAMLADVRTRYVIYEAWIWERVTGNWAPYTGPNLHRYHIHVSVRSIDSYAYDAGPWALDAPTMEEEDMGLTTEDKQWMLDELGPSATWSYGIGQDGKGGFNNSQAWERLSWIHHDTTLLAAQAPVTLTAEQVQALGAQIVGGLGLELAGLVVTAMVEELHARTAPAGQG